jgi:hypothetical protein
VDSVCCESACTGPNDACNLPDTRGTCTTKPAVAPALTPWGLLIAGILLTGVGAVTLRGRVRRR